MREVRPTNCLLFAHATSIEVASLVVPRALADQIQNSGAAVFLAIAAHARQRAVLLLMFVLAASDLQRQAEIAPAIGRDQRSHWRLHLLLFFRLVQAHRCVQPRQLTNERARVWLKCALAAKHEYGENRAENRE